MPHQERHDPGIRSTPHHAASRRITPHRAAARRITPHHAVLLVLVTSTPISMMPADCPPLPSFSLW
eukprot:CAMPEP_0181226728 /NCGR_PEP_ID=MMETSP1096-20121128/32410_1 /TAXON_ID=156174 ORGANISM="Chrysochromulina ericina, Strain CCMP281" /NCGR_SAMPLE_ID=MMETSP1096 /ASSEMBLY_ACC=CAM_ASM_000453 /LENGTH=65 /DNA_ID=CAMNT_0023320087 /DNA_START=376 /DNA_END=570 /DNA_ORIENTATION=-